MAILNPDLARLIPLSPWWLAVPLAASMIVGFVSFYHWSEMISEINGCVPEQDQIPYSALDVMGKPNKFERLGRACFGMCGRSTRNFFQTAVTAELFSE